MAESTAMPSALGGNARPNSDANPYVGPRSFEDGEPLYGRDREALELLDLLIAERIVLLHSPSGAGKSSLLQASLLPKLSNENFVVLPIMRVSGKAHAVQASGEKPPNRYVLNALLCLEEKLPDSERFDEAELPTLTLDDYLTRRALATWPASAASTNESAPEEAATTRHEVLIFDQFEEILTQDATDLDAKKEFFAQVGKALQNRLRWALFVVREDYLGALEPYVGAIPTRLRTMYRLDLLKEKAAIEAIKKPAEAHGVTFTADAATDLVKNLKVSGLYVEPVQLQVVCRNLWQNLLPDLEKLPPGTRERRSSSASIAECT